MARISRSELESLGITVNASGQPTPESLARFNIPVPDHHRNNATPSPAPAAMDGVRAGEPSEDYGMSESSESVDEDESEDELELGKSREDTVKALFLLGAQEFSDKLARIWRKFNTGKKYSNYHERHQWQEDILCLLVREDYIEDLALVKLEEDFFYQAAKNNLYGLARLVIDKVASPNHRSFGR
ncbi:hypothetical protein PG994_012328 [Apiospora phragmitis]|uniref:Uncharacterized protein n=1 Tax=Apiospora phragmitis TaxID=2905665 RepID=A0ABR1TY15_9PEZI